MHAHLLLVATGFTIAVGYWFVNQKAGMCEAHPDRSLRGKKKFSLQIWFSTLLAALGKRLPKGSGYMVVTLPVTQVFLHGIRKAVPEGQD